MSKVYKKIGGDYVEVEQSTMNPDVTAAKLVQNPWYRIFVSSDIGQTSHAVTLFYVALMLIPIFTFGVIWFNIGIPFAVIYGVFSAICLMFPRFGLAALIIVTGLFYQLAT